MNWNKFLAGIVFLIGAFFFYKMRKWGNYKSEDLVFVNKAKEFRTWITIIMCAIVGIVFIFESF
jgi:uncharacterized membrane protein